MIRLLPRLFLFSALSVLAFGCSMRTSQSPARMQTPAPTDKTAIGTLRTVYTERLRADVQPGWLHRTGDDAGTDGAEVSMVHDASGAKMHIHLHSGPLTPQGVVAVARQHGITEAATQHRVQTSPTLAAATMYRDQGTTMLVFVRQLTASDYAIVVSYWHGEPKGFDATIDTFAVTLSLRIAEPVDYKK